MLYMVILLLIWVKLSNCTSQASSLTLDRIVRIVGAGGLITSKLWTIQFMRTWWAHSFFYCVPPSESESCDQSQEESSGEIWAEEDPHQKLHLDWNLWHHVDLLVQRMLLQGRTLFLVSGYWTGPGRTGSRPWHCHQLQMAVGSVAGLDF